MIGQSGALGRVGLLALLALGDRGQADEPIRLPCVADTSICIHADERGINQGAKPRLRVKGNEHILLLERGETAQQDVELLRALVATGHATREELRAPLAAWLRLRGDFRRAADDDAGAIDFGDPDPDRFESLRRWVLERCDQP